MADKDSGNNQPWLVPVVVAVVGAISTVAVAWISKPQLSATPTASSPQASSSTSPTSSPSLSPTASVSPSPNLTSLPLVRLRTFWEEVAKDNYPLALPETEEIAITSKPAYREVRTEGCIFSTQIEGTIPLRTYWNEQYRDNYPLASLEGRNEALRAGYIFTRRTEGYIYAEKVKNSIPLETYWNGSDRKDNYPVASESGREWAKLNNYVYVRTEGYILSSELCK
jgi:hypothetical protein